MRNVYSSLKFRMSKHDMPCTSEKIIMAEVSGERVERKSTSLDEAERRTKCVELASISTSQRKRLYREQAMLLRLDKNLLWLAIRSPTFKMQMWLNFLN